MNTGSIKARVASGDHLVGALLRMPQEDTVEMLGVAGFDFILIDCEHGPADVGDLRRHIVAAELHAMAAVVRVGSGESPLILRALDQGAQGIVMPHVDSPEDAEALVRATHYPPRGDRGFATYPRAGRFGTVTPTDHRSRAETSTFVVAMLESPAAVTRAPQILATPGIDAFLIGAADLSASSGTDDPPAADAIRGIRDAGRASDAARMDLVSDAETAKAAWADGAHLVAYNLTAAQIRLYTALREARADS